MNKIRLLFISMGFATIASQVIIMRRLVIAFGGNELVCGVALAGWLFFSGVGNIISGRFADRFKNPETACAVSLFFLAVAIPATTVMAIVSRQLFGIPQAVLVGLSDAVIPSFAVLSLISISIGISFTIACILPKREAVGIGIVYSMDALGSAVGGILYSLVAIRYFSSLEASLLTAALLSASVGVAFNKRVIKISAIVITSLFAVTIFYSKHIDGYLTNTQWKGYNVVAQKESLFSNLLLTDNFGEKTMFVNGRPAYSYPLLETYESMVSIPMAEHGDLPQNVAIIGGGINGTIPELEKWGLKNAYFLRLDKDETLLEDVYMPLAPKDASTFAHVIYGDGRNILKDFVPNHCSERCLDVIIVKVGDPDNAAIDRYYTREFFDEAKRALKPNGVLTLILLEPSNVISPEAAKVLGTVYKTMSASFDKTIVLPFENFFFIASSENKNLTDSLGDISNRLGERNVASYFRSRTLAGIFQERVNSFAKTIKDASKLANVNTDKRPAAYLDGILLSEKRATGSGNLISSIMLKGHIWYSALALFLLLTTYLFVAGRRYEKTRAGAVLFAAGFASISYEIALIVHYQMTEGLLVWRLGLIFTAFMLGASAGVIIFSALPFVRRGIVSSRFLPYFLPLTLIAFAAYVPLMFVVCKLSFILANFMMGLLLGFTYQQVTKHLFDNIGLVGKSAAIVESSDHFGAALGAILTSVIIIPMYGIEMSLYIASLIVFLSMILSIKFIKKT